MMFDVAVIGAGAMGGAATYHLAKSGANVAVFDQFSVPHAKGSSHAETRLIRQAYFENPNYVPLLKRAYELWESLEETPGQLFVKNGLFIAGQKDRIIMQGILASSKLHAIPIEVRSTAEAKKRFPGFNFSDEEICIFEKNAGYLLVDKCLLAHLNKATEHGATVFQQTSIDSLHRVSDGFSLKSRGHEYRAKKVVACAGAWTSHLLPQKYKAVLSAHRVPLFWFLPAAEQTIRNSNLSCFAFDLADGFFYGFPQIGEDGYKIGLHRAGMKINNPSAFNREVSDDERDPVRHFAANRVAFVQPTIEKESTCIYTMTPDENFIVDEDDGLVIMAGFSGHGFKFASVIGEIAKNLALSGKTEHPIDFLRFRW